MITTGFSLALLTGGAFYMIFNKMPRKVRKFMQNHVLFTDTIACFFTYILFGSSLTALFAAAWLGLIVSALLSLTANPVTNQLLEKFGEKVGAAKDAFLKWLSANLSVDQQIENKTNLKAC